MAASWVIWRASQDAKKGSVDGVVGVLDIAGMAQDF